MVNLNFGPFFSDFMGGCVFCIGFVDFLFFEGDGGARMTVFPLRVVLRGRLLVNGWHDSFVRLNICLEII